MDPLEPIATGTAVGESLSSYVQRLAAEHGTYPGQLVFRIFTWLDTAHPEKVGSWARHPGRVRIGFNNNSGYHADVWLRLLQRFTGRADLAALTTRQWDDCFPSRGFQAPNLSWCPDCLAEDKVPYHRLSWMLQPVSRCVVHRRQLRSACPRCGRLVPVLHDRSSILHCPWCLGDLRFDEGAEEVAALDDFETWCARECGTLVALGATCYHAVTWMSQSAFSLLRVTRGIPNVAAFGRFVGRSKLTAWYWLNGKARPSLPAGLHVYHRFGISLAAHVLSSDPLIMPDLASEEGQTVAHLPAVRHARAIDWSAVGETLRHELERPLSEAPTLLAVADQLRIARRSLRAHEPALCLRLAERNRQRKSMEAAVRDARLEREIRNAVGVMMRAGSWPMRWRDLEHVMGRPGVFNSHYARAVLRGILRFEVLP